jgi:hypothetical protein
MRRAAEDLPAFRLFLRHSQIAAPWEQCNGSMSGSATYQELRNLPLPIFEDNGRVAD